MDNNVQEFQTTLKNGETLNNDKKIVKPNYSRPPRGAMYPRGRAPISVNPEEFRANAVQSWAAMVKAPKKKKSTTNLNQDKHHLKQVTNHHKQLRMKIIPKRALLNNHKHKYLL